MFLRTSRAAVLASFMWREDARWAKETGNAKRVCSLGWHLSLSLWHPFARTYSAGKVCSQGWYYSLS